MGEKSRIKPGDGSPLRAVSGWDALWRTQLGTHAGGRHYVVEADFFDMGEKCLLYRDGQQIAWARSPAVFPLDDLPSPPQSTETGYSPPGRDARIDVHMGWYGMRRAHFVTAAGERQLVPEPGTAEAWRARFDRDHPTASRMISTASFLVLVTGLVLSIPQLLELVTRADWWAHLTDWRFTSPISLPPAVNTVLGVAAICAGIERGLRMRYHWLLDN